MGRWYTVRKRCKVTINGVAKSMMLGFLGYEGNPSEAGVWPTGGDTSNGFNYAAFLSMAHISDPNCIIYPNDADITQFSPDIAHLILINAGVTGYHHIDEIYKAGVTVEFDEHRKWIITKVQNVPIYTITWTYDNVNIYSCRVGSHVAAVTNWGLNFLRMETLPWLSHDTTNNTYSLIYANVSFTGNNAGEVLGGSSAAASPGWQTPSSGHNLLEWFNGFEPDTDFSPYTNGPVNKGKKGGDSGKWTNPNPPTPVPNLPSNTILEAGLLNCYKVTFSDLERIASFMFDPSVTNELMKVGTTLFDYMDGMYQVPVAVSTGANEVMALGNVFSGGGAIASSVSLPTVTEQYYEIDCGTVEVDEYWGNALDYSPYTKVTIMLPYIGAKELSADEVVGKTLHLKYHIDILSGACIAFLYESLTGGEQAVLYEFSGNCIMQLPLRQTDHSELIKGVLDTALAASAGAAVVGHGVVAVEAAGTAKQTAAAHITAEKQFASTESSAVTGIASNVTGAKVNVQRTGNLAGAQGFLGIQKPYLIIQRPTQAYPENMGHYKGFPCNQEARLGDLSGFTVVDSIRLNGLVGTEPEIAEIYDLLSKGVII